LNTSVRGGLNRDLSNQKRRAYDEALLGRNSFWPTGNTQTPSLYARDRQLPLPGNLAKERHKISDPILEAGEIRPGSRRQLVYRHIDEVDHLGDPIDFGDKGLGSLFEEEGGNTAVERDDAVFKNGVYAALKAVRTLL